MAFLKWACTVASPRGLSDMLLSKGQAQCASLGLFSIPAWKYVFMKLACNQKKTGMALPLWELHPSNNNVITKMIMTKWNKHYGIGLEH